MTSRCRHMWLLLAGIVLLAGIWSAYPTFLAPRIMLAAGSGTVAIVVIAHFAVVAGAITAFVVRRRRARSRKA